MTNMNKDVIEGATTERRWNLREKKCSSKRFRLLNLQQWLDPVGENMPRSVTELLIRHLEINNRSNMARLECHRIMRRLCASIELGMFSLEKSECTSAAQLFCATNLGTPSFPFCTSLT